jgi:hypothetical protein
MDRVAAGFGLALVSRSFHERNRRSDVVAIPIFGLAIDPIEEQHLLWRPNDTSPLVSVALEIAGSISSRFSTVCCRLSDSTGEKEAASGISGSVGYRSHLGRTRHLPVAAVASQLDNGLMQETEAVEAPR